MKLNRNYWHALDKQTAENVEIMAKDIGISHGVGDVLQGLKANIMAGASHVELGFTGRGKGSAQSTTPEAFSKEVRSDIKQLAKLNEVTTSTHATVAVGNLSGLTEDRFSDQAQQDSINEVKRAIDFAADTTEGGPVVVHTGEFPRPVETAPGKFEGFPGEETKAPVYLVDKEEGKILQLRKDMKIPTPKIDDNGKIQLDKKGYVITEDMKFQDFVKEQEAYNKKYGFKPKEKTPEELFYYTFLDREKQHASAEERRWVALSQETEKRIDQAKQREQEYKRRLEQAENKEAEKRAIIEDIKQKDQRTYITNTEEIEQDPIKFYKNFEKEAEREYEYYRDGAISYAKQRAQTEKQQKNLTTIEKYGVKKSAEGIARAAIYAYDKEKAKGLKKPLFVAPENVFPEMGYGSHPQELKTLIQRSRKTMAETLVKDRKMSKPEAEKVASDHIRATFDIAHANTWRKFFKGDEKEFKKWLKDEVDQLNKEGIIGHVHLSDNFGYYDEHLTPGSGNTPVKEFVEQMKKAGHDFPMVVEPGSQGEGNIYKAMTGTWGLMQSPIYRTQNWTDIEHSYFGRTRSPGYVVADYAPDQKEWTLYSGIPLE